MSVPRTVLLEIDEPCVAVRTTPHGDGTTEGLYCAGPRGHFNRHWAFDPIRREMVRWAKEDR